MKIVHVETLISSGEFPISPEWKRRRRMIHKAIKAVDWPPGSGRFIIHPESGKKRGAGNGVRPIKHRCIEMLTANGWRVEQPVDDDAGCKLGTVDAILKVKPGRIAFEWETGNISSSHRALNKMALGLMRGVLVGAILVVPSRNLYRFLTDRVGNFDELVPYLDLWKSIPCTNGVLEIVVIEQDAESTNVPRIPKGTDGRATG